MRRCLAERLQEQHFGADPALEKELVALARSHVIAKRPTQKRPDIQPGTTLIREWRGETHRVEALRQGFLWKGQTYRSLSLVAQRITGAHWNGPRFFGLRGKP